MNTLDILKKLNSEASIPNSGYEDINWNQKIQHEKFWFPEHLTPLYYLPIYQKLNHQEKLIYNHYFALLVAEQSVLLEDVLSLLIKQSAIPQNSLELKVEFQKGVNFFVNEEITHTQNFWKLLHHSSSEYNGQKKYLFYKPHPILLFAVKLLLKIPGLSVFWSWLALFAEEKFLVNYREMNRFKEIMDPTHFAIQYAHMLDEARHVQMDELFINSIWDKTPGWLRSINRLILGKVLNSFLVGSNSAKGLWKEITKRHPEMKKFDNEVYAQIKTIKSNPGYQEVVCSRKNATRIYRLFDERKEFHHFGKYLPLYHPSKV